MRKENNLMICTIEELAKVLAESIDANDVLKNHLTACDFCTVDCDMSDQSIADIYKNAACWYGLKQVDLGFDSIDLILASDYYGGGCLAVRKVYTGIDAYTLLPNRIQDMILETLSVQEIVKADSLLLVEFSTEVKTHEDQSRQHD